MQVIFKAFPLKLTAIFSLWLLIGGCNRNEIEGTLLNFAPRQVQVNAGLNPTLAHFFEMPSISTEQPRFQRETGQSWADWQMVLPARATLTITEPGLNWSFAEEVIIQAYTDDSPTPIEIFYRDQIPFNTGPQLQLIPSDRDIKELLSGESVNLILVLFRLRGAPEQRLPVLFEWSVEARL